MFDRVTCKTCKAGVSTTEKIVDLHKGFEMSCPWQELEFLGQWVTTRAVALIRTKLHVVHEWETPLVLRASGRFRVSPILPGSFFPAMQALWPH